MSSSEAKRSILLVDDVELFLELEQTYFHRENFDLLMAINSQEVMQLILQRKPDLVFMDMEISGSPGDKICRWVKQDPELRSIPVIMVVDSGHKEAEANCQQAGCDAILNRPVKRHQLLSVARTFLDLTDRQLSRVETRVPVAFGQWENDYKTNYSVNLSPGGVFVATQDVLPIDTHLSLRVKFPDGRKSLACRGRVAWLNQPAPGTGSKKPHLPTGMGIQFAFLGQEQQDLLKSYLTSA